MSRNEAAYRERRSWSESYYSYNSHFKNWYSPRYILSFLSLHYWNLGKCLLVRNLCVWTSGLPKRKIPCISNNHDLLWFWIVVSPMSIKTVLFGVITLSCMIYCNDFLTVSPWLHCCPLQIIFSMLPEFVQHVIPVNWLSSHSGQWSNYHTEPSGEQGSWGQSGPQMKQKAMEF